MDNTILLLILILAAGVLYSSVGHAGASGYLAVMAIFGLAPSVMKPTALILNILVAAITAVQFHKAGHFSWGIFWPFAISSIPFAFLGGAISLPGQLYKQIVGLVLLFVAYRFFSKKQSSVENPSKPMPVLAAIPTGAGIGLLSGMVGVGGGIFLTPLVLSMGWAGTKQTAGISAMFILVNSTAAIAGHLSSVRFLPDDIYMLGFAAVSGGTIGSYMGSRRFANGTLYQLLSVVLVIAGIKFMIV